MLRVGPGFSGSFQVSLRFLTDEIGIMEGDGRSPFLDLCGTISRDES
jgi:hypothetical protein